MENESFADALDAVYGKTDQSESELNQSFSEALEAVYPSIDTAPAEVLQPQEVGPAPPKSYPRIVQPVPEIPIPEPGDVATSRYQTIDPAEVIPQINLESALGWTQPKPALPESIPFVLLPSSLPYLHHLLVWEEQDVLLH